jgi:endoglucanase
MPVFKMKSLKLLSSLSEAFGVAGCEDEVREILEEAVRPLVDEVKIDGLGNLTAIKNGTEGSPRLMIDAHMDELGFVINNIDKDGFISFATVGMWDERIMPAEPVAIMTRERKKIRGVIGMKPPHVTTETERKSVVPVSDLFIDVGASSQQEVRDMGIEIGDRALIPSAFVQLNERVVCGKAFDDRAGCFVLVEVLRELSHTKHDATIIANFASMEELGGRGAMVAAFATRPDIALVLEGTIETHMPGVPERMTVTSMGKGTAITIMDAYSVVHPKIIAQLEELAKGEGIPYQYKRPPFGGTDAGRITLSRGGVPCGILSVPCRYIHSPLQLMRLDDLEHTIRLTNAFSKHVRNL